jgi:hypothetical protein
LRFHCRYESGSEVLERRGRLPLIDPEFAIRQTSPESSFDLLSFFLVFLFCALADYSPLPHELEPLQNQELPPATDCQPMHVIKDEA